MSLACPQCGRSAPDGVAIGETYACQGCGNPVLAAEPAVTPSPPTRETPSTSRSPWKIAALALVVLAAAHAGLFALLTAEARRERAGIVALDGPSVVDAADPGPPPPADDAKAWKEWNPKHERWDQRRRYDDLSSRVSTMGTWLFGAYAAQAALVAFVLFKASRRAQGSQRARSRAPSPARTPER